MGYLEGCPCIRRKSCLLAAGLVEEAVLEVCGSGVWQRIWHVFGAVCGGTNGGESASCAMAVGRVVRAP